MNAHSKMKKLFALSTAVALLAFTGAYHARAITVGPSAPEANPAGITIKVIRIGSGVNPTGSNSNQPRDRIVFADIDGNVLYASSQDTTPGTSSCVDECAKVWAPLLVEDDAKAVGLWSVIDRADGTRQWAFRDKPMYRFAEEMDQPETGATSSGDYGDLGVEKKQSGDKAESDDEDKAAQQRASARRVPDGKGHDVDGRYVLEIDPSTWITMPMGITVEEVRAASGHVLATTEGRSLYFFSGDLNSVPENEDWRPVEAGQAMLPVGEFTIVKRTDGIYQWAFQDKPLYTYRDDREYGDANGLYEPDSNFQLAYVLRYFMPSMVQVRKSHTYGGLLETTDGRTLYARERGNGGVDAVYRSDRGRLSIGQSLGTKTCDLDCEKTWKPLLASADAKPTGYWGVYDRADGSKQWSYYGYALYTYNGDDGMGSVEVYDDVDHFEVAGGTPNEGIPLHWRVAPP